MLKTFAKYFPLFDHLYIFQLLEYRYWDFFMWFLRNPFKRNLQKKHKLNLTSKSVALGLLSLFWVVVLSMIISNIMFKGVFAFLVPLAWLLLFQITPIPLLLSHLSLYPLDLYFKNKLLVKTAEKRNRLNNLKVLAITGSYGKTSTKDILYSLLWKKYKVVKTPKSFNTPLGVAQTILEDVKDNTDIFIAEIGAYKKGEIKDIAGLIKPEIGIITSVGPQHLNRFGSLENIAKAKFELVESLPKNGLAILNGENPQLQTLGSNLRGCIVNYYGNVEDKFRASNTNVDTNGTSFTLITPKGKIEINMPLIGEHHVKNFLAATAAAMRLGITLKDIKERAKLLLPTPHRMEIKKLGNVTLIDNSYNTNPISSRASLDLLSRFKDYLKVVITPGLVELGKEASKENREFGKNIGKIANEVVIVGENAKEDLLKGLKAANRPKDTIHFTKSTQEALILVQKLNSQKPIVALLENDLPDQYF